MKCGPRKIGIQLDPTIKRTPSENHNMSLLIHLFPCETLLHSSILPKSMQVASHLFIPRTKWNNVNPGLIHPIGGATPPQKM